MAQLIVDFLTTDRPRWAWALSGLAVAAVIVVYWVSSGPPQTGDRG